MVLLADVIQTVQAAYPPGLAEEWDTGIGLTCGDPAAEITGVLLAVDADQSTVAEAIDLGVGLLLTHHPLLFRPVQSVAADTAKGALIHRMITSGIGHFAAHTNADKAVGGVNDALAAALGLTVLRPLVPAAADGLAGTDASAGTETGTGTGTGSGRIGELAEPLTLRAFCALVADRLPATVTGVRAAGDPDRMLSTIAVCGGAGDSFLPAAAAAGVDGYLTSDLRHHVVAEFASDPVNPAVIEVSHWAGEWPWLQVAAALIGKAHPSLAVTVSTRRTDPWSLCTLPSGAV
ncbi:MAG: Nif3-like dinuclear metal center hexameric protein [Nakamurella sp.]